MMHRPCSTYPGQHQCGHNVYYFLIFNISKPTYMYYVFKTYIYSIKEYWWSLTSSWPDEVQRVFFTAHGFFSVILIPQTIFHEIFSYAIEMILLYYVFLIHVMFNSSSSSTRLRTTYIYLYLSTFIIYLVSLLSFGVLMLV